MQALAHINIINLMWWLLMGWVARAALLPWRSHGFYDPLSLLATVGETLATVGSTVGETLGALIPSAAAAPLEAAPAAIAGAAAPLAEAGASEALLSSLPSDLNLALDVTAPAVAGSSTAATDLLAGVPGLAAGAGIGEAAAGSLPGASSVVPGPQLASAGLSDVPAVANAPAGSLGGASVPAATTPPPAFTTLVQSSAIGGPAGSGNTSLAGVDLGTTPTGPATGADLGTFGGGGDASNLSILNKLGLGGVGDFFNANKTLFGLGAGAASLIPLLFGGNKFPTEQSAQQLAQQESATAGALQASALNGVLPAGYEDALQRAKDAADASIAGGYAKLNLSGSSSEFTDVANTNAILEAQRAQLLEQLLTQGLKAGTDAGNLDLGVAKFQFMQDQELQQALQNLAKGLLFNTVPATVTIGA